MKQTMPRASDLPFPTNSLNQANKYSRKISFSFNSKGSMPQEKYKLKGAVLQTFLPLFCRTVCQLTLYSLIRKNLCNPKDGKQMDHKLQAAKQWVRRW